MKISFSFVNMISLTTDLWWSGEQKIGYMTMTSHFIESKWQLHKRVLAFKNVSPPHSGEVLARELLNVMVDWHIRDKIVSNSEDNASANDNCISRLKLDYSNRRNLPLLDVRPSRKLWMSYNLRVCCRFWIPKQDEILHG
ncbi:hypothetical protein LIER_23631 [Lithospermum erythrorhizon]|uniref:Uncharacterized protein n=1 Tax=Lithospermum erythrorhizon TaxID=34254 RepID=A0AAV3R1Q9_LITER